MMYIIKMFPEIMIKGETVKRRMVRQLHENVARLLKRLNTEIVTKRYWDKIEVYVPEGQPGLVVSVETLLVSTPGIDQIWQVTQHPIQDLQSVIEKVREFARDKIVDKTFVVRAKRAGTHDFTSMQLEREVGHALFVLGESAGVDLKHPEVKIEFDVFDTTLNLIERKIPGLGGYPLGSQGEVLSLMSGGFDSTVASYLTMKRGVKTHYVFFNLGGTAHELGVKQVAIYLWNRFGSSHRVKFVTVPFEAVVAEMFRTVHESYLGVMLKRLMLAAAEKVADQLNIDALVTGESVAQVSSQTIKNLAVIDRATSKLVLRPLAFMNKEEIMSIADDIGTRHFAEAMPEYCGVISKNPVIASSFHRAVSESNKFDEAVLDQALAAIDITPVDQLIEQIVQVSPVEVITNILADDVLVDIRTEQQRAQAPIDNAVVIPFYELKQYAKKWSSDKRYLLYCQQGVMSQLHAQYLRDEGLNQVYVYRPDF